MADPQGSIFTLFQPPPGMTRPEHPAPWTPGMPVWHELVTADPESAFRFYSGLFGWTHFRAMDMGAHGIYRVFAAASQPIGAMTTLPNSGQGYGWLIYFHVWDIDTAVERVRQNGGTVLHGPSEAPGGQQVAHCLDTQGACFGIVGPERKSA